MKLFTTTILAIGLSFGTVACVKNIPNHPGAVNPVDNALYDSILTARSTIVSAQAQFTNVPSVLTAINAVIPAFNKLELGYSAYHTALVAGTANPATLTDLQNQLTAISSALASVLKTAPVPPVPGK